MIVISAYKFVTLVAADLPDLRLCWLREAENRGLKGTILLSEEGFNLSLWGSHVDIAAFQQFLAEHPFCVDLVYKESACLESPFDKLEVRIKPEIITLRATQSVNPEQETAPYLAPERFKEWYDASCDMVVLDVRNRCEVDMGTFADAIDLNLQRFSQFPEAVAQLPESYKQKTIVTFCTGGIRCEKAAAVMMQQGFQNVYQLEGGILNYFAECGQEHFNGKCFVFDKRIALEN